MYIARIYYPVITLGYGKRIGIWVTGCEKNCEGCMSDSLKKLEAGVVLSVDEIIKHIGRVAQSIDGVTISGGEPFLQAAELLELVTRLSEITDDIIIYTGYTLKWLQENKNDTVKQILPKISVLIDGEYVKKLDDGKGIRGSSNQKVHIFRNFERHKTIETAERKVQVINHTKGMTVIGIP